ncbi:protogenin A-like isoform X2 [Corticium candelabrum]|uniref:protogenin A-like isoform X2 n=1 Tax=Corticium candelabrum TaxID=121492 RepID=UPI002E2701E8|nr:protogenin A-like isoform X2 [Corticium candelabrum]
MRDDQLLSCRIFLSLITVAMSSDPIRFTRPPMSLYLTRSDGIHPKNGSLHCVADCVHSTCYPIMYSWLYNGTLLHKSTSIREMYENGTIFIAKVNRRVAGWYQCRAVAVRGGWGVMSEPVEVKQVVFSNTFLHPPKSRSVVRHMPAVFQCIPSPMIPPAVITWHFNREIITSTSKHRVLPHGELFIPNVTDELVGKYKCIATNPATGEAIKDGATLTIVKNHLSILKPRRMSLNHRSFVVNAGEEVDIDCVTHSAEWPDRVTWTQNRRPVFTFEGENVKKSQWYCLNLGPVSSEHAGEYECQVAFGRVEFKVTVNLTVKEPLVTSVQPSSVISLSPTHLNTTITCNSSGSPHSTLALYHNTQLVNTTSGINQLIHTTHEIGIYQCVANSSVRWSSQHVIVSGSLPTFPDGRKDFLSLNGTTTLELHCNAIGVPKPNATRWKWRRNVGDSWKNLSAIQGKTTVNEDLLIVEDVDQADGGLYMCISENVIGKEKKVWDVTIIDPIFKIESITMTTATTARLYLSMRGALDDVSFDVKYESSDGQQQEMVHLDQYRNYVDLFNLVPETPYHITVTVSAGTYRLDDSLHFNTSDAKPSVQPIITQVSIISPFTIRVNWSQPSLPPYQPVLGYIVQYQQDGTNSIYDMRVTKQMFTPIKRLESNTTYKIWVMAFNEYGHGIKSHTRTVTTPQVEVVTKTTDPSNPESNTATDNISLGVILGVVGGVFVVVVVIIVVVVLMRRKDTISKQKAQMEAVVAKWEEAKDTTNKQLYFSEPDDTTPSDSFHDSPEHKKSRIFEPIVIPPSDTMNEIDDFVPGYASIGDQNESETRQEPTDSNHRSNTYSQQSPHDDGIPDYAKVNESTKKKYRSRQSIIKLSMNSNLNSIDDIAVMDYAELDMPPGGPPPVVEPEDMVDYAEIDFTQTHTE